MFGKSAVAPGGGHVTIANLQQWFKKKNSLFFLCADQSILVVTKRVAE